VQLLLYKVARTLVENATKNVKRSFVMLKVKIIELPVWAFFDFNKVFRVDCEVSEVDIGSMFS
jgi:hypothetical protein